MKVTDKRGKSKGKENKITDLKPKDFTKELAYDNSFEQCVTNVTDIYATEFESIDKIIQKVGLKNWYTPYIETLRRHSYDIVFFSFTRVNDEVDNRILLSDGKKLRDYDLSTLPTGKCVMLGIDSDQQFRCVVGLVQNQRVSIIYDPNPEKDLVQIFEIGFFISTFVEAPPLVPNEAA